MDENMYPSDGRYFLPTEPIEQKLERQKEKARVLEALKLSEEVVKRLEERIAFYDSVDSIATDMTAKGENFLRAWHVNREVKNILLTEKEWLEDLVKQYKK